MSESRRRMLLVGFGILFRIRLRVPRRAPPSGRKTFVGQATPSLQELRSSDGTVGYSRKLLHGEIGKGLNDYDRIFSILSQIGYHGWISVEDGENGLVEKGAEVYT